MNRLPSEIENMIYEYYNPYNKIKTDVINQLNKKMSKKCNYCESFKNRKFKCGKCLKKYYCNHICQSIDWVSFHKYECGILNFEELD